MFKLPVILRAHFTFSCIQIYCWTVVKVWLLCQELFLFDVGVFSVELHNIVQKIKLIYLLLPAKKHLSYL